MVRQRKEKEPTVIKLKQPDRSGPDPSQQTLFDIANKAGLAQAAQAREDELAADSEPSISRIGDALLWAMSLTMLHCTLDVLVAQQYAMSIEWGAIGARTAQAFPVILLLFYSFHPHQSPSVLLPQLPPRLQPIIHQVSFFVSSIFAGSYLIYITNEYGFYAILKRSPPIGCLWIWAVIELDLIWAVLSLLCCIAYLKFGGYSLT